MSRRTFEGPMDWEYQNNRGPLDMTSPFSQVSQRPFAGPFQNGSPSRSVKTMNPFAALANANVNVLAPPAKPLSPSKQPFARPPGTSVFQLSGARTFPAAVPFRNPSFTTPQKQGDEVMSEYSGADESPAVASDISEVTMGETPDHERQPASLAMTPASTRTSRKLFTERHNSVTSWTPGRGEVLRGSLEAIFTRRDKVRKRKRQAGDRDVGGVRARLEDGEESSEDKSGADDSDVSTDRTAVMRHRQGRRREEGSSNNNNINNTQGEKPAAAGRRGILGDLFTAIHEHPNVPLILSWWVQLGINVFVVSIFMWFVWGGISMMRADIAHAADAARSQLLTEMNACAHEYTKNRCAPKAERMPALAVVCDEWEVCMNQDPSSVMKMQVSAKNVAEIINEFVGAMSFKAWGFIISAMLAMVLASNLGFSRFREMVFVSQAPAQQQQQQQQQRPYASQLAGAPVLPPPAQDPNQAYIWAPIGQTPRRIRREFLAETPTSTEASPEASPEAPGRAAVLAAPSTPSFRRSPSRGERNRSPTRGSRHPSPSKGVHY